MSDDPLTKRMQLLLAPGVEFSTRLVGDRTSYVAYHAELGKYFRFGAEEHFVASLIDGQRTAADILEQLQTSGVEWSAKDITDFVGRLIQHKIVIANTLNADSQDRSGSAPTSDHPMPKPSMMIRITTLLSMVISQRIPLFNGQWIASRFHPTL